MRTLTFATFRLGDRSSKVFDRFGKSWWATTGWPWFLSNLTATLWWLHFFDSPLPRCSAVRQHIAAPTKKLSQFHVSSDSGSQSDWFYWNQKPLSLYVMYVTFSHSTKFPCWEKPADGGKTLRRCLCCAYLSPSRALYSWQGYHGSGCPMCTCHRFCRWSSAFAQGCHCCRSHHDQSMTNFDIQRKSSKFSKLVQVVTVNGWWHQIGILEMCSFDPHWAFEQKTSPLDVAFSREAASKLLTFQVQTDFRGKGASLYIS